ncbi:MULTISPECIES: hypothetical protein [Salibacterium]|uniref:Uncharacterized protein n=2 Tax=Salibacterium TaxID=1884429 RepID=A0A3R9P8G4_9BACI|nr:hypothetical protein [Salibacterium salarium]RSL32645.1 hypothetical protein D7Z54_14435 [Salibacterium salarium]
MSEFTGWGRTNDIDFGDYVEIEMLRYGVPNEYFIHKVIGSLESNCWRDAPIKTSSDEVLHGEIEKVLRVITCGIDETEVFKVRESDCIKLENRRFTHG